MQAKGNDTTTMRGREAEERAARHLERCGQRIVERQRIVLAARHHLAGNADCDCRFDCVLIDGDRLQWIRDAFAADD